MHIAVTQLLTALIVVLCAVPVAMAGDWRIVPRFFVGETYSDNVQLDSFNERSDYITSATPGLSVRGNGARVDLNLDYNLQSLTYVNEEQLSRINHQLQSDLSVEVFENVFFVDVEAGMFQALVANNGAISNRNISTGNNRADIIRWQIRPRFRHHFGTFADFFASTSIQDIQGDGAGGNNSVGSGNGISVDSRLTSGDRFRRATWSISNRSRVFNNDSGARSNSRNSWDFDATYSVNRFFRLRGGIGYASNNATSGTSANRNGLTWNVGATLTLSPRTEITGTYGKRPFGNTKNFSFSHRRRRLSISGSYSERLRTTSEQLADQQLIAFEDAFGDPVFDPLTTADIPLPIGTLSLSDDVFVNRNFSATVGYVRRRGTFSASVFRNEREQGGFDSDESAIGTTGGYTHRFSRRLSGGVNGSFRSGNTGGRNLGSIQTPRAGGIAPGEIDVFSISPFLSYSIGPHMSGRLNYSYTSASADNPLNEYSENRVSGSLSFAF